LSNVLSGEENFSSVLTTFWPHAIANATHHLEQGVFNATPLQ
jgi:hypothetical protein